MEFKSILATDTFKATMKARFEHFYQAILTSQLDEKYKVIIDVWKAAWEQLDNVDVIHTTITPQFVTNDDGTIDTVVFSQVDLSRMVESKEGVPVPTMVPLLFFACDVNVEDVSLDGEAPLYPTWESMAADVFPPCEELRLFNGMMEELGKRGWLSRTTSKFIAVQDDKTEQYGLPMHHPELGHITIFVPTSSISEVVSNNEHTIQQRNR